MKRILIGTVALMMTLPAFGDDGDKRTTSKPYVDTQIATKQLKIPAANTAGVGAGDSVITYTNVAGGGVIGERALFTGGEYNASTDADKMITASALNNAFTNLPTTDTTTLECANPGTCTLWTIVDQTAYGINGDGTTTTIDLASIMGMSRGEAQAYRSNSGTGDNSSNASTYGVTQNGTWVVDYGNGKRIRGKTQCSTESGTGIWDGASGPEAVTTASRLPDASGQYCWCQLDGYTTNGDNWGNMTTLSAPWVFEGNNGKASSCAKYCARNCSGYLWDDNASYLPFRVAMFNSVQ